MALLNKITIDAGSLDRAFICKLNGSAFFSTSISKNNIPSILRYNENVNLFNNEQSIISILHEYSILKYESKLKGQYELNFSWENSRETENLIVKATTKLTDAANLVIIGYSFPIFNSRVDKFLLENLPKILNVFIQCPVTNFKDIEHRFRRVIKNHPNVAIMKVINIPTLDFFYIPNEIDI